jgi:hypothetical protein
MQPFLCSNGLQAVDKHRHRRARDLYPQQPTFGPQLSPMPADAAIAGRARLFSVIPRQAASLLAITTKY